MTNSSTAELAQATTVIRVQHGRTEHEITLPTDQPTCAALKQAVAHLCPPQQACFLARGKKLSRDDDSLAGVSKVTLLTKPLASLAMETQAKVKLTLRDFVSERIVRDVDVDLSIPITDLTALAQKALQVPPALEYMLFVPKGKQMMRSDLKLADYATSINGVGATEIFLAPCGRGSCGVGRSSEDADGVVQPDAPARDGAALEAPAACGGASSSAAMVAETKTTREPSGKSVPLPAKLSTGTAPAVRGMMPMGGMGGALPPGLLKQLEEQSQQVWEALPADVQQGLDKAIEQFAKDGSVDVDATNALMLQAMGSLGGGGGGAHGSSSGRGEGTSSRGGSSSACMPSPFALPFGIVGGDSSAMEERRIAELEEMCGKMVDELQPDRTTTASGGGGSGAAVANVAAAVPSAATTSSASADMAAFGSGLKRGFLGGKAKVKAKKRSGASWGEGLRAGFLSKPQARKRQTAPPTVAPAVTTSDTEPVADPAKEQVVTAVAVTAADGVLTACDLNQCQPSADDEMPTAKRKSVERPRCETCAVRLPLTACHSLVCRCGGLFCSAHLHGGHECSYDYKGTAREKLREAMPKIEFAKL